MNILFINNSEINPLNSGIQRITSILVKAFISQGVNCYGGYFEANNSSEEVLFIEKIKIDFTKQATKLLTVFIKKNLIRFVIVQECWPLKKLSIINRALSGIQSCQLLYCYHSMPGKEFIAPSYKAEVYRLLHAPRKVYSLKKMLTSLIPAPLYRQLAQRKIERDYSSIYQLSDQIILLSENYIPVFSVLAKQPAIEKDKFIAIGNSLSFDEYLSDQELHLKKKEVLIVARLSEQVKRISIALKIWQVIERSGYFHDWRLKIVGSGSDEKYYHHMVRKLRLKQVDFEGKQNPQSYYKRASILMLTSSYEGFGMVLTEAQQLGCVPIAFESYSAVHDIIQHGENGIIVPDRKIKAFADQLIHLMNFSTERIRMAHHGLLSCKRFSKENIIQTWITTLTTLESSGKILRKL